MIMKAKNVVSYYIKFVLTHSLFYFISFLLVFIVVEWLGIVKEFLPIVHVFSDAVIVFLCCYIYALILGIWLPQKVYIDCLPRIFEDNLKWFDNLYGTYNDWIPHEFVPKKLNNNFMTSRPVRFINDFSVLDPMDKFVFPAGLFITYFVGFIAMPNICIICVFLHNLFYYIMILLHQQYMWHLLSKENEFYYDRVKVLNRLRWLM